MALDKDMRKDSPTFTFILQTTVSGFCFSTPAWVSSFHSECGGVILLDMTVSFLVLLVWALGMVSTDGSGKFLFNEMSRSYVREREKGHLLWFVGLPLVVLCP